MERNEGEFAPENELSSQLTGLNKTDSKKKLKIFFFISGL